MSRSSVRRISWGFLICLMIVTGFVSPGSSTQAADESAVSIVSTRFDNPAAPDSSGGFSAETGDPDNVEPTLPEVIRKFLKELLAMF